MGWRFHKVLSLFPFLRLNLSKGGLSTSLGPRGADVNIGRGGVTTNAGIPGTGLSYRQKMGGRGSWIGILTVAAGLGLFAFKNLNKIEHWFGGTPAGVTRSADGAIAPRSASGADSVVAAAQPATGIRYVRRNNSDLRAKPSTSSPAIAHEPKGAKVTVLSVSDKWTQVNDGTQTGWMRTSVLGETPPNTD